MTAPTGWDLVTQQRISFAEMIEGLEDQSNASTLCGHWTVHEVAAHLLTFTNMSFPKFMFNMAKNRFDYDTMADKVAKGFADEFSLSEVARELRANATTQSPMPGFPAELTLSDVSIHRQDIRRALDLGTDFDPGVVESVLGFMTSHKQAKNLCDTTRLDGVTLKATDMEWSSGSGATIEGTGEALMMGLAGRPVSADLSGDGVARWFPN